MTEAAERLDGGVRGSAFANVLPLPAAGRAYYLAVVGAATFAGVAALTRFSVTGGDWVSFVVLSACAALAQLFIVRTGRNHGFHTAIVFVVAAALILPPPLVFLMAIVQHGPEWIRERYPWFIQSFNIANFALGSLAAWAVADGIRSWQSLDSDPRRALAGLSAAVVFIAVNHTLLAGMLRFGRGLAVRDSGLFSAESLGTDLVLGAVGAVLAVVWVRNPWLVPAVIAPIVFSQRSFRVVGHLRDSEERFRTVFDAAPIGMIVRDLDGQVLSTNSALAQMLGYSCDELVRMGPRSLMPPDERAHAEALYSEVVTGLRDGYSVERRFTAADGSDVFASVDVALVRDAGERPSFVVAMVQNVTDRKQLEEQLLQAQKMEAVGRLAGGVAHDFNNLLTAITGYAEFAADRPGAGRDEALRGDIGEIRKAARRAHELTKQLLAFSRKQILQPQVVDLRSVVADVDPMLRRLIGEDIEIVTVHRSNIARVRADPGQLQQVIVNLAVNARDELPNGGSIVIETAHVTIDAAEAARREGVCPGDFVTLAVKDDGRGMDAATKARLFEPFFTRKEVGKGTGLGLATVYGIVKQSGGFIEVDSEPGQGATFTIFLPSLGAADEPESVAEAQPEPVTRGSETVLLVEDDEVILRFVRTVLDEAGYSTIVASDGHEAIELAAEQSFDLLLTDLIMPKMNGRDLAARLRAPVVFMSGYSQDLVAQHGVLDAGTTLIQKPFTAVELKQIVRDVLDRASG